MTPTLFAIICIGLVLAIVPFFTYFYIYKRFGKQAADVVYNTFYLLYGCCFVVGVLAYMIGTLL
jgi:uncharacterized membrane protein YqiK